MKIKLLILLSLFISSTYSQVNTVCKYQLLPITKNYEITKADDEVTKNTKKMLLEAFDIAQGFDYILKFNKIESSFRIDESMINESLKSNFLYNIAKSLIGKGLYYQNREEKKMLHQKEVMGELFIIKDSLINDWQINGDSKKIGNYVCFRATKKCKSCSSIEEVWFTPEIPTPFGPLGQGGLPGLIVEIRNKGSILRLVEIKYQKKPMKIEKPYKGKIITINEYNKMVNRIRGNAKKMSN